MIVLYIISGYIVCPFITVEPLKHPRPLNEFICTQQEIYHLYGKLKHKSGQQSQRNRVAPHIYRITLKAEFRISAGPENTCDKTGIRVDTISNDIASIHVCRVYLSASAAESTSIITMTFPDVNGVTYTGSITFVAGEATAYNA